MKVGLDRGQRDINHRAIDKSQTRTENGGNKDPQPRVWVTRTFGTRRSHYGFIARCSHGSYWMLLTIQWSAGRPRPAISDVDGRDARRSIVHGSRDERNRAEVLLEPFRRIQQYRDWAFIDQFHLHRFLKSSGFAAQAGGADSLHKIFVEFARLLGRSGRVERWPFAAAHVTIEGELRDH